MNIFEARKLQNLLYKNSECDFKRMRTQFHGDKLCYTVSHHISDRNRFIFPKSIINRLFDNNKYGVETHIIHDNDEKINVPNGMYILEIIIIDD